MCSRNASNSHIVETADLNDDANSPLHVRNDTPAVSATNEACVNATLLPTTLLQRATSDDDLAAARPSVEHDEAVASIYTQTLPITASSRSHKHLHVILSRLACQNTTPQTTWYQRARCASLESRPRNLIEESCLDFTAILEKCTDTTFLHQPGTQD